MCANGTCRHALAGAASSLVRSASAKVGRDSGVSSDINVQHREGNENEYFIPYFLWIRRHCWGRDYDRQRRRKGGGRRRWSAMDPPLPNLGGP